MANYNHEIFRFASAAAALHVSSEIEEEDAQVFFKEGELYERMKEEKPSNDFLTVPLGHNKDFSEDRSDEVDHNSQIIALNKKVHEVFGPEIPEEEHCTKEFSCWMLNNVLLKGVMYLTSNYLLFHAPIPEQNRDEPLKSGWLVKKSKVVKVTTSTSYWFILQKDVLRYYENPNALYCPLGALNLKNIRRIERKDTIIKIYTLNSKIKLEAETVLNATEWQKAIEAAAFTASHDGSDVKIILPFQYFLEISMSSPFIFKQSVCVKMADEDLKAFADEYFFAYFIDSDAVLKELNHLASGYIAENRKNIAINEKRPSLMSPGTFSPGSASSLNLRAPMAKSYHRRSRSESPSQSGKLPTALEDKEEDSDPKGSLSPSQIPQSGRGSSIWSFEGLLKSIGASSNTITNRENKDQDFRTKFALPDSESIIAEFRCFLYRTIPRIGKLYLSNNYVAFRSNIVGVNLKVLIPIERIQEINVESYQGVFYNGICIRTKDQSDFYLDFYHRDNKEKFSSLLDGRINDVNSSVNRNLNRRLSINVTDLQLLQDVDDISVLPPIPQNITLKGSTKPMHITLLTVGSRGDVQPYIALCKRFMEDGHTCRIGTHKEFKDWILGHGIEFREVAGNPADLISLLVENSMFSIKFIREGVKNFSGWMKELHETCYTACIGTDAIISAPTAFAGIHVAEKLGVPYFETFTMPWTRTKAFPHPFAVTDTPLGFGYNYMTYVMYQQIMWIARSNMVNEWRQNVLQLPPTNFSNTDEIPVPMLYCFSPSLLAKPSDWRDWIHITGFWFLDGAKEYKPSNALADFLSPKYDSEGKVIPIIYIGFGSIVVSNPEEMLEVLVEGVKKANVRCILSKGWSGRKKEESGAGQIKNEQQTDFQYPDCIYLMKESIPHDWLFPQMNLVMHHGGAGTVAAGLRAGVPTIVRPFFGDQFFWGDKIIEMGIGTVLRKLTADKVASAITSIISDEKMRERSKLIGERIRAEDGTRVAVDAFYRDLPRAWQTVSEVTRYNADRRKGNFLTRII